MLYKNEHLIPLTAFLLVSSGLSDRQVKDAYQANNNTVSILCRVFADAASPKEISQATGKKRKSYTWAELKKLIEFWRQILVSRTTVLVLFLFVLCPIPDSCFLLLFS
jgi:hypothetical protein